jgi:hypothetical protein
MKTVLQELIENLESNIKGCEIALIDTIDKEFVKGTKRALEDVKIDISKYLEKEKEQIIEAGNVCSIKTIVHREKLDEMSKDELRDSLVEDTISYGEDYYNQTYNQNI